MLKYAIGASATMALALLKVQPFSSSFLEASFTKTSTTQTSVRYDYQWYLKGDTKLAREHIQLGIPVVRVVLHYSPSYIELALFHNHFALLPTFNLTATWWE